MNPTVTVLAKAAGLEKALEKFPDDVQAAATQAMAHLDAIRMPRDPAVEPWPPMRAGDQA